MAQFLIFSTLQLKKLNTFYLIQNKPPLGTATESSKLIFYCSLELSSSNVIESNQLLTKDIYVAWNRNKNIFHESSVYFLIAFSLRCNFKFSAHYAIQVQARGQKHNFNCFQLSNPLALISLNKFLISQNVTLIWLLFWLYIRT